MIFYNSNNNYPLSWNSSWSNVFYKDKFVAAEITQWIEHLLHKREDLSSTSQVYIKSCGQWG